MHFWLRTDFSTIGKVREKVKEKVIKISLTENESHLIKEREGMRRTKKKSVHILVRRRKYRLEALGLNSIAWYSHC